MTSQIPESTTTLREHFLDAVLSQVRFRFDHPAIRRELLAHIEDRTGLYLEEGESPEDAAALAVAHMGDAEELGRQLNREHSPLLGWLWRISGAVVEIYDVPRDLSRLYWSYSRLDAEICVEIPLIPNYEPEGGEPT